MMATMERQGSDSQALDDLVVRDTFGGISVEHNCASNFLSVYFRGDTETNWSLYPRMIEKSFFDLIMGRGCQTVSGSSMSVTHTSSAKMTCLVRGDLLSSFLD